jgi:ATP-dependent Zn protease
MMLLTRPVSFATEQEVDDAVERLLHRAMEEHCWTVVADVAKQLHEWATNLAENRSADVSCQLSTLKQRRQRQDKSG